MSLMAALKRVTIFSGLSDPVLQELIRIGQTVTLPADEVIYRMGDAPDSMYVILDGAVRVYIVDEQKNEIQLKVLEAGSSFGELAMLDSKPRSASVACTTAAELFVLNQSQFMALIQSAPGDILPTIFSTLTSQVRNTTQIVVKEAKEKHEIKSEAETEQNRLLAQMAAGPAPVGEGGAALEPKELVIQIDELARADQVAEITDSDYFRALQDRAEALRKRARHSQDDGA